MDAKLTAYETEGIGDRKTWSDAAREAAMASRRLTSQRGGETVTRGIPIRHQLSHHATVLTVQARNASRAAKTPADHEEAASQHMNAAEAHREAMAVNRHAAAHHQSRIDEHERQGGRHMEEAERLRGEGKAWSPEARAAALEARRRNAGANKRPVDKGGMKPPSMKPHAFGEWRQHEADRAVAGRPVAEADRSRHFTMTAVMQSAGANNSSDYARTPKGHDEAAGRHREAAKAHGSAKVAGQADARDWHKAKEKYHNAMAAWHEKEKKRLNAEAHDKWDKEHGKTPADLNGRRTGGLTPAELGERAARRDNQKKKPAGKSFFQTGDAVELKTTAGKLLVVDAGIDAKAGPWVAVRETRAGVPGASQRRFVVKPGELKAWEGK